MDTKLLKQKILDLAIRGKLVPQDPNDEPASILLEKIRKEKQELIKQGKIKKDKNESTIFVGDDKQHYEKFADGTIKNIENEIPFEIPDTWCWCRLGQIGIWGAGSTPNRNRKEYYNGNIPWLKTGELNDGFIVDSEEKITNLALETCNLKINKVGNILIAMYGATIGKLGIAGIELTTNQACCGCEPFIYNKYLFFYLMGIKNILISKGSGGAQPNISKDISESNACNI